MRILILILILPSLISCRAMDTRDHDFRAYRNEQNRFYIPEKNARVGFFSHAYRWKSGQLQGFCTEEEPGYYKGSHYPLDKRKSDFARLIVDNVILENTTLFATDSATLSETGKTALQQLVSRMQAYENIRRLELEGHTDARGSIDYNQNLSTNRVESVKKYILEDLGFKVQLKIKSSGELKPIASNLTAPGMQKNRRVEARIVASGVRKDNTDSTLCHHVPDSVTPTNALHLSKTSRYNSQNEDLRLDKFTGPLPVSVGDHLRIAVAGDDTFDGIYEVTIGGGIELPMLGDIPVHGLTVPAIKKAIGERLVEQKIIRSHALSVDVAVLQWSTISVFVRGAVFVPGRASINIKKAEDKVFDDSRKSGDYKHNRLLSKALVRAGGVRPDADLSAIQILRDGQVMDVDLSGFINGQLARDLPLISGDEVIVPSTGYFQKALVRPSQITPPGIRVFMSNPTVPIYNNTSAAIGGDSTSLPYGTRFLRGLVSANCVGGMQLTNASRRGVLISTNPLTGATEVIERSIQQLISDPDRDDINPHLLPNDGLACYDSDVSNLRDVARSFADILAPFASLRSILDPR